ncbi:MAG: hypothetical protein F4169_04550, partial [Gammaproteobacteria bacterium]|nr:hypothetical protein [Gammaproteobacteria bacterium]
TRTFSGMPERADTGTVPIKGAARDRHGDAASDTFDITVVHEHERDRTAPRLLSAWLRDTALVLSYDEALDPASAPAPDAYTVTASAGTAPSVTGVAINAATVTLTLSEEPDADATIRVTYAVPASHPVRDAAGNAAAGFTDRAVAKDAAWLRLVDGDAVHEGRVEMHYAGEWRSLCDVNWKDRNADVVCRQLGYAHGAVDDGGRFLASYFGKSIDEDGKVTFADQGKYWLDDVQCRGEEAHILECPRRTVVRDGVRIQLPVGEHNCRAGEAAGVRCRAGAHAVPVITAVRVNDAPGDPDNAAEPGADGYTAGETLAVTLQWSEPVVVRTPEGREAPKVAVDYSAAGFAAATYASGSGTAALVFTHTLPDGAPPSATVQVYRNTHLVRGLQLRGSTITSKANPATHAELVHLGYPEDAAEVPPPQVRRAIVAVLREAASQDLGTRSVQDAVQPKRAPGHGAKEKSAAPPTIEVRLVFDRAVVVDTTGGTPSVAVVLADGEERRARYVSGSGTAVLVFRYRLAAGERAPDPVRVVANSLSLDGGTIRGEFGRDARLAHAGDAGAAPAVVLGAPVIVDAPGAWRPGETVVVTLSFDRAVEVEGAPTIAVVLGGDARREAECVLCGGHEELVFAYRLVEGDGAHTTMAVPGDTLALNGGRIHSDGVDASLAHAGAARTATPAQAAPDAPTARFAGLPARNDGVTPFRFELHFSAAPDTLDAETLAGGVLEVRGGAVTGARRLNARSAQGWAVEMAPSHGGAIDIVLPVRECAEAHAVCFAGAPLAEAATATVPGVALTAAFTQAPPEHDGARGFELGFELSETPHKLSYQMLRRSLLLVRGGRIEGVRRFAPPDDRRWVLAVAPSGTGEVTLRVRATRDCAGLPNVCTPDGRKLAGGLRAAVPGPASLSVADARADEDAEDAALGFVVTLSRARHAQSTVDYATSDATATAGADYTAVSGTLVFAAGETEKTVSVAVHGDAHDEGEETLTLTLSNPTPAAYVRIGDGEATGRIVNDDAMPRAWLARLGRTVGAQVLDALGERLDGGATHVTVGGIALGGAGRAPEDEADPFALPEWATRAREAEARTPSLDEVVLGSAFHLSAGADDGPGPAYTAWGRIERAGFGAEVDEGGERLALDGEVTTGLVGFDVEWERLLAGVVLSQSRGVGAYRSTRGADSGGAGDGGAGSVESALAGLYPYARVELSPRVSAWGVAGAGAGELRLRPSQSEALETGMSLGLGAL